MPINHTDQQGNVTVEFRGCVVDVRTYVADRNHSDTLDYTDFRITDVTEALVYLGRTFKSDDYRSIGKMGEQMPIEHRFAWVDCTNLFVWRGQDSKSPAVDLIRHPDCVEDYIAYLEFKAEEAQQEQARAEANAAKRKQNDIDRERNSPVPGKKMTVTSGRKVKPGHQGTVAYVHSSGRVLLKPDSRWQDRKADGVWVEARHLSARV